MEKKPIVFKKNRVLLIGALLISFLLVILTGFLLKNYLSGRGELDERFAGKWIAIKTVANGVTLPATDIYANGFSFELKAGGKMTLEVDGEKSSGKWSSEGDTINIQSGDDEWTGTITGNMIEFFNVSDMGVDILFGKEGTDAMDPIHTLSEGEKQILGVWVTESLTDVMGQDLAADPQFEGIALQDILRMTFNVDRTLNIVHKGQEIGTSSWVLIDNWGASDDIENYEFMYAVEEDGKMTVDIIHNDTYLYKVVCVKVQ